MKQDTLSGGRSEKAETVARRVARARVVSVDPPAIDDEFPGILKQCLVEIGAPLAIAYLRGAVLRVDDRRRVVGELTLVQLRVTHDVVGDRVCLGAGRAVAFAAGGVEQAREDLDVDLRAAGRGMKAAAVAIELPVERPAALKSTSRSSRACSPTPAANATARPAPRHTRSPTTSCVTRNWTSVRSPTTRRPSSTQKTAPRKNTNTKKTPISTRRCFNIPGNSSSMAGGSTDTTRARAVD